MSATNRKHQCATRHTHLILQPLPDFTPSQALPELTCMNLSKATRSNESPDNPTESPLERGNRNLSTYLSAAEMFRISAARLVQNLHHLVQARDAFEQATIASAGLPAKLDAVDDNLRTLMTQIEQALAVPSRKPAHDEGEADALKQPKGSVTAS
jgi:hypothetical protein